MEIQTKLEWSSFENLFGTWANRIKPFFDRKGFDPIYEYLKKQSARGKVICPSSSNVFKCFLETPYEELKAIIIGISPYHSLYKGTPVSDGLLMSCSVTGKLQPSLEKWYDALEKEYNDEVVREPNLDYLAKQGLLMLNIGLTCEAMKPASHSALWEPFMKFLFEEVIVTTGTPVVFLGKESLKVERYLSPFTWIFKLSHPAAASYSGGQWDSEGMFLNVNRVLMDNNKQNINWLATEK